jgi:hypothetical protein
MPINMMLTSPKDGVSGHTLFVISVLVLHEKLASALLFFNPIEG